MSSFEFVWEGKLADNFGNLIVAFDWRKSPHRMEMGGRNWQNFQISSSWHFQQQIRIYFKLEIFSVGFSSFSLRRHIIFISPKKTWAWKAFRVFTSRYPIKFKIKKFLTDQQGRPLSVPFELLHRRVATKTEEEKNKISLLAVVVWAANVSTATTSLQQTMNNIFHYEKLKIIQSRI